MLLLPGGVQHQQQHLKQTQWKVLSDLTTLVKKGCKPSLTACWTFNSNHPIGGRYQITPHESSGAKIASTNGITTTASVMLDHNPYIAEWSPDKGAATLRYYWSNSRLQQQVLIVSCAFLHKEYFERMDKQADRWSASIARLVQSIINPAWATINRWYVRDLWSNWFNSPTLRFLGVTTVDSRQALSPEFKTAGSDIYYIPGQAIFRRHWFWIISALTCTICAGLRLHKVTYSQLLNDGGVLKV